METEIDMKENFPMMLKKVMGECYIIMENNMKENLEMMSKKDMVYIIF